MPFLTIAAAAFDTSLIWNTVRELTRGFLSRLPLIVMGVIVFLVFLGIGAIVARAIRTGGAHTRVHQNLLILLSRLAQIVVGVFGFLVASVVIFPGFQPGDLIAGLGITSVAIGFAFKDVLQNFFAGVLILWREPFGVGDEIVSGDYSGIIESINTRSTRVRTFDGHRVILPNADVYTRAIVVRTAYPSRRLKIPLSIGLNDDIERIRKAILDALRNVPSVLKDPRPEVWVENLASAAVDLSVLFWIKSKGVDQFQARHDAYLAIKRAMAQDNQPQSSGASERSPQPVPLSNR